MNDEKITIKLLPSFTCFFCGSNEIYYMSRDLVEDEPIKNITGKLWRTWIPTSEPVRYGCIHHHPKMGRLFFRQNDGSFMDKDTGEFYNAP